MHHGTEFAAVILFSLTLAVGSLLRLVGGWLKVPYTIAMLVLGLGVGVILSLPQVGFDALMASFLDPNFQPSAGDYLLHALGSGMRVEPDLIIYAFLPALVYESAFAIDLHVFKKTVGPAIIYAAPGLVVATALSGALLYALLGVAGWDWDLAFLEHGQARSAIVEDGALLACLYFGALISATDPVAVVALLRELGVSKKLSHLIDGEALLNDGTAIVASGVMLELVIGKHFAGTGSTLWHLTVVVAGGLTVGFVLALITAWVLARTFNDPLVEITATLVLAYVAMWVAEGLLHVSGVMALVAAGLWMGGPARTTVSPEVGHFLHQFWGLLAHLANTLIFFLVGLIIGKHFQHATAMDFGIIVVVWAGVMAIRFIVVGALKPMAEFFGDPISRGEVLVISWGGLRGAVSMALVLALATNASVPAAVSQKMLLLTAGVVFLTIAVNGMTMGKLLSFLGFDKPSHGEVLTTLAARADVLGTVRHEIEELRTSRELRTVRWAEVVGDIDQRREALVAELGAAREALRAEPEAARASALWGRVLGVEREAYWQAFGHGTLGSRAVKILDHELNGHMDAIARGEGRSQFTRLVGDGGLRGRLMRVLRDSEALAGLYASLEFEHLELRYDLLRAIAAASSSVLTALPTMTGAEPETLAGIRVGYEATMADAKLGLEEMRVGLPEITAAIETRIARRVAMNLEREALLELGHSGALPEPEAVRLAAEVEARMARLTTEATRARQPELVEVLSDINLFRGLDKDQLQQIADAARLQVLPAGEQLFAQGERGDAMFVIVRGAVHVTLREAGAGERLLDVLGGGDILGEMALLTGAPRTASALCATPVTVVRLGRDAFDKAVSSSAELAQAVWSAFSRRRFDNTVRGMRAFGHLDGAARTAWFAAGEVCTLADAEALAPPAEVRFVFVAAGQVRLGGSAQTIVAPALFEVGAAGLTALSPARLVLLPAPQQPG